MPDINQQIVVAYEEAGLTPEEIAADLEMELTAVKLALAQSSATYRKAIGKETEDISDNEVIEMKEIIKGIARTQQFDNPGVALKAATWVYNEKKGRNDLQVMRDNQVNVVIFNERLSRARERMLEMKKEAKLIEV
jgi:hypothetical protein